MAWYSFLKKNIIEVQKRSFVGIRMEAIGGQGANSAGKIVASTAVMGMGYTGNHFSSFGSEKRGTPVKSFVRFSTEKKPVRSASFIKRPQVLLIFHESLIHSHQDVLFGVDENCDVIINTSLSADSIHFPKEFVCRSVTTIDGTKWASKIGCTVNAVMLGTLSLFLPEVNHELWIATLSLQFAKAREDVKKKNENGFLAGTKEYTHHSFIPARADEEMKKNILPDMGWKNAPIGGVVINPGNTILKDHAASRKGTAPRFEKELCFNCGYCDMICPDFCFVWDLDTQQNDRPQLLGIDYQYCKGCQKCIEVCPVSALTLSDEDQIPESEKKMKLYKGNTYE